MADNSTVNPINVSVPRLTGSAPSIQKSSLGAAAGKGAVGGATAGSTFGPIGALLGSVIGAGLNMLGTGLQNRYNRKQADKEWRRNLEQWNRENAYNSPSAQMARFQEAGLNPNLMYAQGNAGNAGSSPSYESNESADLALPMIGLYQSLVGMHNNTRSVDSQVATAGTQQALNRASASNLGVQNDNLVKTGHLIDAQVGETIQRQLKEAQEAITETLRQHGYELDNKKKEGLMDYEFRLAEANAQMAEQNVTRFEKDMRYLDAQTQYSNQMTINLLKDWTSKDLQQSLYQKDIDYYGERNKRFLSGHDLLDPLVAYSSMYQKNGLNGRKIDPNTISSVGWRFLQPFVSLVK